MATAALATLAEMKAHLGVGATSPQDFADVSSFETFLQDLMDNTEELLEGDCRESFEAGSSITDEPVDGTGTEIIYVRQPIATMTSVKIGEDETAPDDTLDSFPDELDFEVGKRFVLRRGGDVWPRGRRNLYVTYVSQSYAPLVAKQAFYEGVAFLYRRRGKEHVSSATVGELGQLEAAARFDLLPAWGRAAKQLRVPVIV